METAAAAVAAAAVATGAAALLVPLVDITLLADGVRACVAQLDTGKHKLAGSGGAKRAVDDAAREGYVTLPCKSVEPCDS